MVRNSVLMSLRKYANIAFKNSIPLWWITSSHTLGYLNLRGQRVCIYYWLQRQRSLNLPLTEGICKAPPLYRLKHSKKSSLCSLAFINWISVSLQLMWEPYHTLPASLVLFLLFLYAKQMLFVIICNRLQRWRICEKKRLNTGYL